MNSTDYREALRLLNNALAVVEKRRATSPESLRRRLRRLSLSVDLLRARLRQAPVQLQRN